ncbi:MAG: hypothetical protein GC165_07530 [Armatimonadetes bacterium]|nr:hypothetical protein [Armatimonadota bacterium]
MPEEPVLLDEDGRVSPIKLISDEAISQQEGLGLGMDVWAHVVAGVATGTKGPFTIGVFAPWGRGKTSVLQGACALAAEIANTHAFIVNAWEHERHPDPLQPIIADILRAIDRRLDSTESSDKHKRLNSLKKILTMVTIGAGAIALGAPALAIAAPGIADTVTQVGKTAKESLDQASAAKKVLDDEVKAAPDSGGTGLRAILTDAKKAYMPDDQIIVFIDDLDRCHPDKAVLILESIKHLLWVPGFVFVLALDNVILEKYLQKRYEKDCGLDDDPKIGKKYLEKLVQLTLYLPESPTKFEEFVRSVINTSEDEWLLPESLIPLLVKSAETSPRQAKRRINDLIVDTKIFAALPDTEGKKGNYSPEEVAACMAVNRLLKDLLSLEQIKALTVRGDLRRQILSIIDETWYEAPELELEPSIAAIISEILLMFRAGDYLDLFEKRAIGRTWFENDELRQASREFLIESRGIGIDERRYQEAIVDKAIRRSLGLKDGEAISKEHRAKVEQLSFEYSHLDNSGLCLLTDLSSLSELYLKSTQISDLTPLVGLTSLTSLGLANTQVFDLSPLAGLPNLTALYLYNTQVSNFSVLASLPSLRYLTLPESIPEAQREQLRKSLPYLSSKI